MGCLKEAEVEHGGLEKIVVERLVTVRIYYRERREELRMGSNSKISDLHEELARRLIPKESQKLLVEVEAEER